MSVRPRSSRERSTILYRACAAALLVASLSVGCAGARDGAASGETAEAPEVPAVVDATTLDHKMLFGYQGWFLGAGDGSPVNGWRHWFRAGAPTAANLTIDLWPDTSELAADELFATDLAYADGSVARLYSAYNPQTVARHFAWMKQAGIDARRSPDRRVSRAARCRWTRAAARLLLAPRRRRDGALAGRRAPVARPADRALTRDRTLPHSKPWPQRGARRRGRRTARIRPL